MSGTARRFERPTRPDWFDAAACKGQTELFYGPPGYESAFLRDRREARAVAVCQSCAVRLPCRAYARREREQGVWGGEVEIDRFRVGRGDPTSTVASRLGRELRRTADGR